MNSVRYVALGDSYTIGEGATESFPSLLAKHLTREGIPITLIANPSKTGWTTRELIDKELPVYRAANPEFATVLIGVNDWVQQVSEEEFRQNFGIILDEMLRSLPSNERLIVITIPDFSATPKGKLYGGNISAGIAEFNVIIKEEARARNLSIVDIYSLSQGMNSDPSLIAKDGLHPSTKEYSLWEEMIYPVAKNVLGQ